MTEAKVRLVMQKVRPGIWSLDLYLPPGEHFPLRVFSSVDAVVLARLLDRLGYEVEVLRLYKEGEHVGR